MWHLKRCPCLQYYAYKSVRDIANESQEESSMGGNRRYEPILLCHELDLPFLKNWPEPKFRFPISKIMEAIAVADGQISIKTPCFEKS